ncbi:MAG: hypothetical protein EXQ67_02195 [Thermoleophilia bacterium]|nr:hypothetical protein [Thermoleophilia bacterium]
MTLIAAIVISLGCIVVAEPRLLGRRWPPYLLAAGAGIGISYTVVHLLPEIAIGAEIVRRSTEGRLPYADLHAYLLVLIGIIGTLFLRGLQNGLHGMTPHPQVRIVQPALSALIVGYLLAARDATELGSIALFTLAIGLHVALNAHGLATRLGSPLGGMMLALAIAVGYALGLGWEAPSVVVAGLVALLAGGVMTRTIHEVLDEESHLVALTVGVALEATLLLGLT